MKLSVDNNINQIWDNFRLHGSQDALSFIYYEHFDFLYDFASKITLDKSLVEDSIQNVFGYLLKKRKNLGPVSNLRFYLLQSLRRELLKQLKKNKRISLSGDVTESLDQFCFNKVEDTMDNEERDHIIYLVKKSIEKLGPKQQEIIYLKFNQDFDYSEIAKLMSISVDSCYKSIYRSIKFIKEDIEKVIGKQANLTLWICYGLKKIKKK